MALAHAALRMPSLTPKVTPTSSLRAGVSARSQRSGRLLGKASERNPYPKAPETFDLVMFRRAGTTKDFPLFYTHGLIIVSKHLTLVIFGFIIYYSIKKNNNVCDARHILSAAVWRDSRSGRFLTRRSRDHLICFLLSIENETEPRDKGAGKVTEGLEELNTAKFE